MATRERLPQDRESITRRFEIYRQPENHACPHCGHAGERPRPPLKVYATVGKYPDGRPGEIFLHADQVGMMTHAIFEALALVISVALQYGVPLEIVTSKFRGTKFAPAGLIKDPVYRSCTSVIDLLAKWLDDKFGKKEEDR